MSAPKPSAPKVPEINPYEGLSTDPAFFEAQQALGIDEVDQDHEVRDIYDYMIKNDAAAARNNEHFAKAERELYAEGLLSTNFDQYDDRDSWVAHHVEDGTYDSEKEATAAFKKNNQELGKGWMNHEFTNSQQEIQMIYDRMYSNVETENQKAYDDALKEQADKLQREQEKLVNQQEKSANKAAKEAAAQTEALQQQAIEAQQAAAAQASADMQQAQEAQAALQTQLANQASDDQRKALEAQASQQAELIAELQRQQEASAASFAEQQAAMLEASQEAQNAAQEEARLQSETQAEAARVAQAEAMEAARVQNEALITAMREDAAAQLQAQQDASAAAQQQSEAAMQQQYDMMITQQEQTMAQAEAAADAQMQQMAEINANQQAENARLMEEMMNQPVYQSQRAGLPTVQAKNRAQAQMPVAPNAPMSMSVAATPAPEMVNVNAPMGIVRQSSTSRSRAGRSRGTSTLT